MEARTVGKLTRSKPPEPPPQHWLVRLAKAPAILAITWPLLLVVFSYIAWQNWGAERVGRFLYSLQRENISVTPPPEYIRSDIVGEVFRTHQLERTNLLSRMATAVVGEAFKTHPWVESVVRVEKHNGGVDVQLRYRRPIAMVRVRSQHPDIQGDGLFAIDSEAVLLPMNDFSPSDQNNYLQILVPDSYPAGVGAPYGDERVIAAAKIAKILADYREQLNLFAIELTNPKRTFDESWVFDIIRNSGDRFTWGSPPGEELPNELSVEEKLQQLRSQSTFGGNSLPASYQQ